MLSARDAEETETTESRPHTEKGGNGEQRTVWYAPRTPSPPADMSTHELSNTRVIVAGAGLAGLAAARDLELAGASVVVCEARGRVGGRVHTLRDGFAHGQHAEAGADLIEGAQRHLLDLATAV